MPEMVAMPEYSDVRFYGVTSKPDVVVVEAHMETGDIARFIIRAEDLKALGIKCYAQAKVKLGELAPDDFVDTRKAN